MPATKSKCEGFITSSLTSVQRQPILPKAGTNGHVLPQPPQPPPSPLPPILAFPSAKEAERGVPRASLPTERRWNRQGIVGIASGASCPPLPFSEEAQSRVREDQEEPNSNREPDPATISTTTSGSPSGEAARRPGYAVAFPVAIREPDPSPAGCNIKSAQQQSEFYFNLGRRMMLDSIE